MKSRVTFLSWGLGVTAALVAAFTLSAATLHVALESANPSAPFAAWETAATSIQDAIDAAHDGDTVLVTNVVYAVKQREVMATVPWVLEVRESASSTRAS